MNDASTATMRPVVATTCQITSVKSLSKSTYQIELKSLSDAPLNYRAGQYLQLELDVNNDGQPQRLSYSIANSFNLDKPKRLEIFIQNSSEFTKSILRRLATLNDENTNINVTLPMGFAFLQSNLDLNHLLIASGSGISKIKCLTEEILKQKPNANINIYWSNKKVSDFYLLKEFKDWVEGNENLSYTPVLESADADWLGRSGYIYKVIEEDFNDIKDAKVYLCGSPQMVYGTIDKLKISTGLKEKNCYSDVFEYAPRN